MRKLLKRWYVWLGLVVLLGLAGSVSLILANQSPITQANFDRIQEGMNLEEVERILGKDEYQRDVTIDEKQWEHGPNQIIVRFQNGKVYGKGMRLYTVWETLLWYAKMGTEKTVQILRWH